MDKIRKSGETTTGDETPDTGRVSPDGESDGQSFYSGPILAAYILASLRWMFRTAGMVADAAL